MSNDNDLWKQRYLDAKQEALAIKGEIASLNEAVYHLRERMVPSHLLDKGLDPTKFAYWLLGFADSCGERPTEEQWKTIMKNLEQATPPWMAS